MKIKNFAVLKGSKTTVKDGVIHYDPEFTESKGKDGEIEKKQPLPAEIRTEVIFNQGILQYKIKASSKDAGVLIYWDLKSGGTDHAIGLSRQSESFIIYNSKKSEVSNGGLKQFKVNEEITIRIEIFGSECKLFVNNILYCEDNISLGSFPLSFRISSSNKVSLYDINLESVKPKLFVVMQFTNEFNNLYNDVIIPVSEKAGFDVIRADEFYSSTPILTDIIKSIKESSVIIADITPDNPNVFYEIGYAHAINKPTILICDKTREKLPFDVSSFRTLFYENSIAGKSKVENSLRKYLESIVNNGM